VELDEGDRPLDRVAAPQLLQQRIERQEARRDGGFRRAEMLGMAVAATAPAAASASRSAPSLRWRAPRRPQSTPPGSERAATAAPDWPRLWPRGARMRSRRAQGPHAAARPDRLRQREAVGANIGADVEHQRAGPDPAGGAAGNALIESEIDRKIDAFVEVEV